MPEYPDSVLPTVDTSHIELWFSPAQLRVFHRRRGKFVTLIHSVVTELGLHGRIEHLAVSGPTLGRACLYRKAENPWPSKRLNLEIYLDRYMDARLIRHEFGHEADRWNPEMLFDNDIHERLREHAWALDTAANISLDARLGRLGLGRRRRRDEFLSLLGTHHARFFSELWASPPSTWPEIEALALRLAELRPATASL